MLLLKTPKELQKNLRSRIKKTNIKKRLKYYIEYREFLIEVNKLC
jgi:2-phosphoglycerate kinase